MKRFNVIRCPHCNREYLPEEIYLPNEFFGQPRNIVRNNGKILYFDGKTLNTSENYICDECNKEFTVTAQINFVTKSNDTFDECFTTKIYDDEILLDEESEDENEEQTLIKNLW